MKILKTTFIDYIKKNKLHKNLYEIKSKNFLETSIIIYGPEGCGKYSISLDIIKRYSKSKLKYKRNIIFNYNKKYDFKFKISDIHYEIDFNLLLNKSNVLWNTIYNKIIDIISTKDVLNGIILCKNFDNITNDLLETFYSYMQCLKYLNINLKYIFIVNNIGFLPNSILDQCAKINIPKPKKEVYEKIFDIDLKDIDIEKITNIKGLQTNNILNKDKIVFDLINYIYKKDINYTLLREKIYNLLIYNLNIHESIWIIFDKILKDHNLTQNKIQILLDDIYIFFKYYNNNYRPIYHLEFIILKFYKIIHFKVENKNTIEDKNEIIIKNKNEIIIKNKNEIIIEDKNETDNLIIT